MKPYFQLLLVSLLSQVAFSPSQSWTALSVPAASGSRSSEVLDQARQPASIDPKPFFRDIEDSITLYVVPPPKRLSWESPQSLARSTLWSIFRSSYHSIGHVTVQTQCTLSSGRKVSFWTGMTASSDNPPDKDLLVQEKLGLGILFYPFKGSIETSDQLFADTLIGRERLDRLFTLRFLISRQHCDRVYEYYRGYVSSGPKGYGFVFRPRHREGAGCTAYAASYLEVAGLLSSELKRNWRGFVRVPRSAIGTKDAPVELLDLATDSQFKRWASPDEPHRPLYFYDTQFIYDWSQRLLAEDALPSGVERDTILEKKWKFKVLRHRAPVGGSFVGQKREQDNGFYGILFDSRHVPAARDPIWRNQ